MSLANAVSKRNEYLVNIGKMGLNVLFPKEFEVYICALELTDTKGNTLQYFIFPVMPSALSETETKSNNIKRTLGGVTSLSSTTFVPVDILLTGNFGRKFKVLVGSTYQDFINSFKIQTGKVTVNALVNNTINVFDDRIKTGYGCLKVLEEMIDQAQVVDNNGPRRLLYYNLAFGSSYVVKPISFKIDMTQETNMIHGYTLQLKAIAPIDALQSQQKSESDAATLNITSYVQKKVDQLLNSIIAL